MVKKRGAYERIEKVTRKKRTFCPDSETSANSPAKKDRNLLNDKMLSLYKEQLPASNESSALNSSSVSVKAESFEREKPQEVNKDTEKSKLPRKSGISSEKKKSLDFGLKHSSLTLADVGGINEQILKGILRKFFPFLQPEVFGRTAKPKKRGFLLHGPSGCGKTHLVRAIAGEFNVPYIEVNATELVRGISGESESKIREMFDEAIKSAPCILFIDEIDVICPKENSERGMERRMVSQMLKCFDELKEKDSKVMVLGATNKPDVLDPCFRRGGRFSAEFAIGMPDEEARLMILKVLCKEQNLRLGPDCDLKWLAHHTPGYVGADLECLVDDAIENCFQRTYDKYAPVKEEECKHTMLPTSVQSMCSLLKLKWEVPEEELDSFCFEMQDFQIALQNFVPSSKKEGFSMVPDVTWDDVGALKDIKEKLHRTVIWPVKYREVYQLSGFSHSNGILLYGPKGCGKTLLAKAIANECSINFLSVKGPELFGMYVGESERRVRECFQRARHCAPCIIFFDEIDAICSARSASNTNAVAERVVNQLLTEMDGVVERKQVFVIGATNFLEKIDPAMLRPGRLDKAMYVGLPSADDREDILNSLTKNKTRPKVADDVDFKLIAFDERCENFSGADMAHLVNEASEMAMMEHVLSSSGDVSKIALEIKFKHFELALEVVKASVSKKGK